MLRLVSARLHPSMRAELESIKEQLLPQMESECGKHGIEMVFFMLTNIIEESTELRIMEAGQRKSLKKAF